MVTQKHAEPKFKGEGGKQNEFIESPVQMLYRKCDSSVMGPVLLSFEEVACIWKTV